jgi:Tfp pilus assembly protein PilP
MKSKFTTIFTLVLFSTCLIGTSSAAGNAFGSLISENNDNSMVSIQSEPIDQTLHPLIQNTIASNSLVAVMVSQNLKIGLIRTLNGDKYFIRIGDKLGNSNGTITSIKADTIEITEEGKVVSLAVRNRSVTNETTP